MFKFLSISILLSFSFGTPTFAGPLSHLPKAIDGATACNWENTNGGALGLVLPSSNRGDIPGPNGNEISQMFRIFALVPDKGNIETTHFVGWLAESRGGEVDFAPVGVNATIRVDLSQVSADRLPINQWLERILANTRIVRILHVSGGDQRIRKLAKSRYSLTAIAPCYMTK